MEDKENPCPVLHLATALIINDEKEVLLVRKSGTSAFMQAGGKIVAGETPLEALQRELEEELGFTLRPEQAHYIGVFKAPAAHEPDHTLEAHCYYIANSQAFKAHAEITEVIWADPFDPDRLVLASLTRDYILPAARHLIAESSSTKRYK